MKGLINNLPEVEHPTEKRLPFNTKLKWTLIVLVAYFVLGMIPLFGVDSSRMMQFEQMAMLLGAEMGTLLSLGIGPIVTASIVLQLLVGAGILKFNTATSEGKRFFQGVQKLLGIGFIIFEGFIYVFMGGLPAVTTSSNLLQMQLLIIFQLILGGILVMLMDEVISKWGFGSGISLFIAAGISKSLFIRAFSWFHVQEGAKAFIGAIPELFRALSVGDSIAAVISIAAIVATVVVFGIAVFAQAMKIEIPLSFGRIRGHGVRWPLNFIYTSNIPVILVAALLSNIQMFIMMFNKTNPDAIISWISGPNIVYNLITGTVVPLDFAKALVYMLIMIGGSVLFSFFWVQTSGMDARKQAEQIMQSGFQRAGFRRDPRVMEKLLERYIGPLTVMGGMTVGFLAALADLSGSLVRGTGILLTVMIIYKLYEDIARQHMMDLNPAMKKFMGK
ncbi:preprotein translocase subunit SecY [Candidatus Woesearchaeota archaeon]|nr:preprotein translocase subunit SecY [Candidatus Woesearchaeota archaeon]